MIDLNPWGELYTDKIEEGTICVMGVPFDGAVSCGKGTALAPERIRQLSRYLPCNSELGQPIDKLKVYDHGDVAVDLNWPRYYQTVETEALKLLQTGKFCLFLGGDHSVAIPLQKAFGRYQQEQGAKKIGIIHFDSHFDLMNEYDSFEWSHATPARRALESGVVKPEGLAFCGIRSAEQEEYDLIKANPEILVIQAYYLWKDGWEAAFTKLKERFQDYDAVYFTLDIDFLDPAYAPGTGTPEAGGPSSRELMELTKAMLRELPIKAMDVVEVSPPLDVNDITSWAALKNIYEVFTILNDK